MADSQPRDLYAEARACSALSELSIRTGLGFDANGKNLQARLSSEEDRKQLRMFLQKNGSNRWQGFEIHPSLEELG